jgi:hypothetical protein
MYKRKIFENVNDKSYLIRNIEKDYLSGKTLKEIANDYSFSERQIRHIINYYIKIDRKRVKKQLKRKEELMKEHEVIKLDDDKFLVDNKPAKKATLEDMVSKAKEELRKQKKRSTNKKVENNK